MTSDGLILLHRQLSAIWSREFEDRLVWVWSPRVHAWREGGGCSLLAEGLPTACKALGSIHPLSRKGTEDKLGGEVVQLPNLVTCLISRQHRDFMSQMCHVHTHSEQIKIANVIQFFKKELGSITYVCNSVQDCLRPSLLFAQRTPACPIHQIDSARVFCKATADSWWFKDTSSNWYL